MVEGQRKERRDKKKRDERRANACQLRRVDSMMLEDGTRI